MEEIIMAKQKVCVPDLGGIDAVTDRKSVV